MNERWIKTWAIENYWDIDRKINEYCKTNNCIPISISVAWENDTEELIASGIFEQRRATDER